MATANAGSASASGAGQDTKSTVKPTSASASASGVANNVVLSVVSSPYPAITFSDYAICGYQHNVQVSAEGVYWTTTIYLDIEADSSWSVNTP